MQYPEENIQEKVLWKNSNPSNSFEEQVLNIDLTEYRRIKIEYRMGNSNNYYFLKEFEKDRESMIWDVIKVISSNNQPAKVYRLLNVSQNQISFGNCYFALIIGTSSDELKNSWLIPTKIIGIK